MNDIWKTRNYRIQINTVPVCPTPPGTFISDILTDIRKNQDPRDRPPQVVAGAGAGAHPFNLLIDAQVITESVKNLRKHYTHLPCIGEFRIERL